MNAIITASAAVAARLLDAVTVSALAVGGLILVAGPASAKDRMVGCEIVADGRVMASGLCEFRPHEGGDGSFNLESPNGVFAVVLVEGPGVAKGYWNGAPGVPRAHDDLGDLRQDGACWKNARSRVCAR